MPAALLPDGNPAVVPRIADAPRPLRIAVVGAGVSGILAGIKLPQVLKENFELVIYDKNADVGGTWFENRYPGVACDIPAHCYQLSFESNPSWTQFYASGPEILQYWKRVAEKHEILRYLKLRHQVQEAQWSEMDAKWHLKVRDLERNRVIDDAVDVLYQCVGALNSWKWPDIPGRETFQGRMLHTADWDTSWDYTGKRIAVIGMGSSGLQVMPELQKRAAHIYQWMRGKTWITAQALDTTVAARTGAPVGNFTYKPDEMDRWKEHPEEYLAYRRELETMFQSYHGVTMRGSEAQAGARVAFEKLMREGVAAKEGLADILLPDFPPLCKRQTPGHAFLSALTKDNVDLITTGISHFDATGIVDVNGTHYPVDAIVCATGFDTTYTGRFPCLGRNGADLRDHWKDFPRSYLSLATDGGFPNCFFALGPNSSLGAGNLLILIEQAVDYVGKCCVKLQREYLRTLEPSHEAVEGFVKYAEEYFKGTVYSEECSSWYKGGKKRGRVVALWPGSSLHAVQVLEAPRWEDFTYTYIDGCTNGWLGNGWTVAEREVGRDRAFYLNEAGSMLDEPRGKPMIVVAEDTESGAG